MKDIKANKYIFFGHQVKEYIDDLQTGKKTNDLLDSSQGTLIFVMQEGVDGH